MSKKNKFTPALKANIQTITPATKSNRLGSANDFLKKHENVIVIFLFCIALVVRLFRINYINFWVDEFVHVNRSLEFLKDFKFSHIFGGEKNGILVTILNIAGFALFGKNEFGGRFFIGIISAGLIPATYYFCKKLFNNYIGLMSCLFLIFSQYLVFWGRMDRQYGPISTFYILLILGIVSLLQSNSGSSENNNFWSRYNLNKKWVGWTVLLLFLSFLTNLETFFILFSSGAYAIYLWLEQGISTKKWFTRSEMKVAVTSILSIVFFLLTFTPLNRILIRPLFLHFMPEGMVSLIIPDWAYIKSKLISTERFNYFMVYWNVITTDLPYTIYFFFLGLLIMAIMEIKKFILILSYYLFPFSLMSFVFLDPCLPRYHAFIYPLYIIVVASFFYYMPRLIIKMIPPRPLYSTALGLLSVLGFFLVFYESKAIINSFNLITVKKHGTIIDKKLSQWSFTNWKGPSFYVKQHLRPSDLIFATVPAGVDFYLDPDKKTTIYPFRQMKLNPETKSYIPIGNTGSLRSATSYDDLYNTMKNNERIWLIADYYLYNVLTDDRCRDLVFQNFTLIPEACKDGSTQLFLLDPFQPKKFKHNCIWELGKPSGRNATPELSLKGIGETAPNGVTFTFQSTGIDSEDEAAVQLNGITYYLPKPKTFTSEGLGISEFMIPSNKINMGDNDFRIVYFERKIDPYKGYIIYNMEVK